MEAHWNTLKDQDDFDLSDVMAAIRDLLPEEKEKELDQLAQEFEQTLKGQELGVKESAVIGVPHPDFGEAVTAVVVLDSPGSDAAKVIEHVKQHAANFKVPKSVHIVDNLPRNAMGKVQKNLLREQLA